MSDRVIIFDTTLRDGEQSPGASMNAEEKLRLAIQLEKLGVDVIEAGFPSASIGDLEAVHMISEKVKGPKITALARTTREDIDSAWRALKNSNRPRINIFIATSDIHLVHKLKLTRDQVKKATLDAIRYAKKFFSDIEFSAEDGSRSDKEFLCDIFELAIDAGAKTVNLPDTVGYAMPDEFSQLVGYIMGHTPNISNAVMSVHCHNDLGLATANTLAAIKAGARQVEVTINGIGERAGNTSLEEVVMGIYTRKEHFGLSTGIKTDEIHAASRLTSLITGIVVQPNKAVVGSNAFSHEAGIHQDGILKAPITYEIMKPETIGLSSSRIILGKHSGRHALKEKIAKLGYELNDEELESLFKRFKALADKRKEILDDDIEAIIAEEFLRTPDIYKLEYLNVISGTAAVPTATVKMAIDGRIEQSAGFGVGPIDATFNTIAKMAKAKSVLIHFSVDSITGGMDAQGEVMVKLKEGDFVVLGKGADPDIITASAKAYINGLNRLEYMKRSSKNQ